MKSKKNIPNNFFLLPDKYDVESCQDLNGENKMNLNFTLNLDDR